MEFNLVKKPHTVCLILAVITITAASVISHAQESDTIVPAEKNPYKILRKIDLRNVYSRDFNVWDDKFTGHWAGVDFGLNMLLDADYSGYDSEFMKSSWLRSNSAYVNLIQQSIGLQRNRNTIGLVTGAGLQLQSYRLDNNTTLQRLDNGQIEPQRLYFDQNQKSKFSVISLIFPLLTEFQIPVNHYRNRLYFSGGLYGSIRVGSHTKIKYRSEGKKIKRKIPGHYSLHDFKYGVMVRAGYRRINLFASYELVPLFKKDKGPVLMPFTLGITLAGFTNIFKPKNLK
jgi:hypothetical protein